MTPAADSGPDHGHDVAPICKCDDFFFHRFIHKAASMCPRELFHPMCFYSVPLMYLLWFTFLFYFLFAFWFILFQCIPLFIFYIRARTRDTNFEFVLVKDFRVRSVSTETVQQWILSDSWGGQECQLKDDGSLFSGRLRTPITSIRCLCPFETWLDTKCVSVRHLTHNRDERLKPFRSSRISCSTKSCVGVKK